MILTLYIVHGLALLVIFLYTLHQYYLFFYWKKSAKHSYSFDAFYHPPVCIQLPIFNEKYVLKSLFDHISQIEYPNFEIQVLDDSNDGSEVIVRQYCDQLMALGINCSYIHRTDRKDFKAGALKNGLNYTSALLIAILDADFRPEKDWLSQVVQPFKDPKMGFVQCRWDYYNRSSSWLSEVQAMALDYHFCIEQQGRLNAGLPFNFNGTAGIWRKETILDSGNWHGDTLTEDLDLSVRAYLRDWKAQYLPQVSVKCEIPETVTAMRSQQFRWNKGGAQNLLKFFTKVLSTELPFLKKVNIIAHLFNSSIFKAIFLFSITSIPILYLNEVKYEFLLWPSYFLKLNFFFIAISFFLVFRICNPCRSPVAFLRNYILFFPFTLSISFHNCLAVLEAYLLKKSDFIRTPKFNSESKNTLSENVYHKRVFSWKNYVELGLFVYFIFGIFLALQMHQLSYALLFAVFAFGYFYLFIMTLNE